MLDSFRNVTFLSDFLKKHSCAGIALAGLTCLAFIPCVHADLLPDAVWSAPDIDDTYAVDWGDWDGDGDLDLAVGNVLWPNQVFRNDGGSLTEVWTSPGSELTYGIAWGDWDGDGDLDLAAGNFAGPNMVYETDGGTLKIGAGFGWSSIEEDATYSVAWADWNNDGDLDLAVGNWLEENRIYDNNAGTLSLTWSSTGQTNKTRGVVWGDWNNDGLPDLAAGNWGQLNHVWENLGGGVLAIVWSSTGQTDNTSGVSWGDWNGDGNLDLAASNWNQINRVYENDGLGLSDSLALVWSSVESEHSNSVAWGDWDGDGDLDLAVGNNYSEPDHVYENDGLGNPDSLTLAWDSAEGDETYSVVWGDWDEDGDLDLAAGNDIFYNRVYENNGNDLAPAWSSTGFSGSTFGVAWGDWNGDGDLDLATANLSGNNRVFDSAGGNLVAAWSDDMGNWTLDVAWGDWNGDGIVDLAVANSDTSNRVYQNDGLGGPTSLMPVWSDADMESSQSIAWGDWNGDGDLDLAVGNAGEPNRVYENTGITFSKVWASAEAETTQSVAWGDVDGDGDLDLAVGNDGQANHVYLNEGGTLQLTACLGWTSIEVEPTQSVAWGDWDGDGDLDLAVGNANLENRVYENTNGDLVSAWVSDEADWTYSVAWGDWDGDGDLDLAAGNDDDPNRVYENTGGNLGPVWSHTSSYFTQDVAWGDWNGDGDIDLAMGNWGQLNRIFANSRVMNPGGLPETPAHPVTLYRPDGIDTAFFHSTPQILSGTILIPYTLVDEQGDKVWEIITEYSPNGGGQWFPATEGIGGDGTTDLAASPAGTAHTFSWDAATDEVDSDNVVFRISARWQAPDHVALPVQRPILPADTPPFRVDNGLVNPTAVVTPGGPTAFCDGGNVDLAASSATGTPPFSFLWAPGGETAQTINVTATGKYSVKITDANGGKDVSAPECVTVFEIPAVTISESPCTCLASRTLTAVVVGGQSPYDYLWSPGGETTSPIVVSQGSGPYDVMVTDVNTCFSTSAPIVAGGCPLVVDEVSGPFAPPLLVVDDSAMQVDVEDFSPCGATHYVVYESPIGAWYGTPSRSICLVEVPGASAGMVRLDYEIADDSWIVVSGASLGGETGVGADSAGVERDTDLNWPPSGPCP
jgi:hypothetical protein